MAATGWAERQRAQAAAFDDIGARYDELFPHKEGQLDTVARLVERLTPGALDVTFPALGTPLRVSGYLRAAVTAAGFTVDWEDARDYAPPSPEVPPETQLFVLARR